MSALTIIQPRELSLCQKPILEDVCVYNLVKVFFMTDSSYHLILAYYYFTQIKDPNLEVENHKEFLKTRDITSRIYISEDGINGQLCGSVAAAHEYMEWMRARPDFTGVKFKVDKWHEHVFPRQAVKYRKDLVAYGKKVCLSSRGEEVAPSKWKEMLESDQKYLLIDVRNDYEWEIGRFCGAELPNCKTFREFEEYAERLKKENNPKKTPVMMYCTGGIRCELYSSVMKEKGFEEVYQLEGGVINYGHKVGAKHWLGKLFVFDDRLSVPICDEDTPVVGRCYHCQEPSDAYYNCANMDCNFLFLCCLSCLKSYEGCCQSSCQCARRVRPYHQQNPHKPFRKKHQYENKE